MSSAHELWQPLMLMICLIYLNCLQASSRTSQLLLVVLAQSLGLCLQASIWQAGRCASDSETLSDRHRVLLIVLAQYWGLLVQAAKPDHANNQYVGRIFSGQGCGDPAAL